MTVSKEDQEIALAEEVRCAIYFIEFGLIALNRLENVEHLHILLLSNGFERLLKVIFCLDYLEQNSRLPNEDIFPKTHDIEKLLKKVFDRAKQWNYAEKCETTRADMDFLEKDCDLKKLVKILTDYGKANRYYNFDVIICKNHIGSDPTLLFESYRTEISKRMPNTKNKVTVGTPEEGLDDDLIYANRQITKSLQRFARALFRMFIWGKVGQYGDKLRQIVGDFLVLQDAKLEQVEYRWLGS